jgi:hypothetical protein
LKREIAESVFDEDGNFRRMNKYGVRNVCSVRVDGQLFFLKKDPEAPGIEHAVQLLSEMFLGKGVVRSKLLRFHQRGINASYPVLLSEGIEGENLRDVLRKNSSTLKLDWRAFSQLFVLHLLSNPEDASLGNFILTGKGNTLVSVDNDHSFLPTFATKNDFTKLLTKSIVFCLDQMNDPIHPAIREIIEEQDPKKEVHRWLEGMRKYEEWVIENFPDADRLLRIIFPAGFIRTLLQKWTILVELIRASPSSSCLEILAQCDPKVEVRYREAIKNSPHSVVRRYNQISSGLLFSQSAVKILLLSPQTQEPLDLKRALDELELASVENQKTLTETRIGKFSTEPQQTLP